MKGTKWRNKAQDNLLLKSIERSDHLRAAKEWEFTGKVIDHEVTDRKCELCEGENLRYHFCSDFYECHIRFVMSS